MDKKIKLKGHESFSIREGWITKGIFEIKDNPKLFSEKNLTNILGIGTNMVKSLKYWLITAGVIKEVKKMEYELTELGKLIKRYDPYMEDVFSLYFIHLAIVTNIEKAIVWNIFFNKCNIKNFSKRELLEQIKYILDTENLEYNEKMLIDEISILLKTYTIDDKNDTPENNLTCPLTELKLIRKVDKDIYQKEKSTLNVLNPYVVYWCMINQTDSNSINIDDLFKGDNSVCKLLNLDKMLLNEYLDILKKENLITINRTAGLNMVYINKRYSLEEIFEKYFEGEK